MSTPTNNEPLGRVMFESPNGMIYPATKDSYVSQGTYPVLVLPWDEDGQAKFVLLVARTDYACLRRPVNFNDLPVEHQVKMIKDAQELIRALAPDEKGSK